MPALPTYNSKVDVNTGRLNVNDPQRSNPPMLNDAAPAAADQEKITSTLSTIGQKLSDANDVMQYTEAKTKHAIGLADIEQRAQDDLNFKNSPMYMKQIADLNDTATNGIDNQHVAQRASSEFQQDAGITAIKINHNFQQKQLSYNKDMVNQNVQTLLQQKLGASTDAESANYDLKIHNVLNENVTAGTLSPMEADKILKDSQETAVKYQVYADTATEEKDSTMLKELQDPKGKYSFLDPDIRLKMIEEDQHRIFQNNQTVKKATEESKNSRFNDIFTKANEGTLTLNDLDKEMAVPESAGGLPQKQILDIRKSLQGRIKNDLETVVENNDKAGDYLKFVENFISDETDREKGREAIVQAFKDGILSPKEANFLNTLKRQTEQIQWDKQKEGMTGNNLIPFKNTINAVGDWFKGTSNHTESDSALAIKKLLSAGMNGQDLTAATHSILNEERTKQVTDIKSFPTKGQKMVDPVSGVTATVYPDGSIEVDNGGVRRQPGNTGK